LGEESVSVDVELRRSKQLEFLLTVLQSVDESNVNPDVIYPLFRQNLDLLDLDIIEILRNWANAKFEEIDRPAKRSIFKVLKNWITAKSSKIDRDTQRSIVIDIINFGNLIQQFPLGNKAVNMELSIECYSLALKVFTLSKDPEIWGNIQNSLAVAYKNRIRGDRAENLEQSIECYRAALEVFTQTDFPIYWASTQNNLATAYGERIRGDRAENLERSIDCYQAALEVRTQTDLPLQWADTQNNLATAYSARIRGDRAENLEQSIECYRAALEVFTQTDFPIYWATTQNNLANAYSNRIRGDSPEERLRQRAENLERSIECYRAALAVFTQTDFPIYWASTQNNLATAYGERIRGDRAENLERSIDCYQAALEVRTQTDLPLQWADTQNNLATAYSARIRDDSPEERLCQRAENLERSIECYRAALEVYTVESFPREWARIQVGLAQFSIEQLQNYQFATEHLQFAYSQLSENNNDTGLLAQTMFELARCFHKTGSLGQAKLYFKDSIRLYQRLEQPTQVAAVTSALGNLELQMGAIDDARIHLQTALEFYQAAGNLDRVASIQDLQQCLPEYSPEPVI
jgi:tetratricopeptide (TPR) repeat protein